MHLGLDFGTSGARACLIDAQQLLVWQHSIVWPDADAAMQPTHWRNALLELIGHIPVAFRATLNAIAVDATSGTVLLTDAAGNPVSPVLPYDAVLAHNPTAKLAWLRQHATGQGAYRLTHQVDYCNGLLLGAVPACDYHNALKSGFDPQQLVWREGVYAPEDLHLLPSIVAPGTLLGHVGPAFSQLTGINSSCQVRAGTTDSIAAFLAASPLTPGSAVTSLGSTLAAKLLSTTPVWSAKYGIYSHRLGTLWLTGGASNSGGAVLRQYFDTATLERLSAELQPERPSGLDYYPLRQPGERFPIHDPTLAPRITPRPGDDRLWLQGLLEGMAQIERLAYERLVALGATPPRQILSTGGGSRNPAWQIIRERIIGLPIQQATHHEAAYGSALLASELPNPLLQN